MADAGFVSPPSARAAAVCLCMTLVGSNVYIALRVVRQALVEGSAACNSGIVPGDCLMEVNGKNVYCKGIELATKVHTENTCGHCPQGCIIPTLRVRVHILGVMCARADRRYWAERAPW